MRFTAAEFDTMVQELLYAKPISFDMLCKIAEKTLKSSVRGWCEADLSLKGRECHDDIMQEIQLRLIQKTVPYFLLRNGVDAPYNNDPEGFEDWMFKLAKNVCRDYAGKVRREDFKTEPSEELPELPAPASDADEQQARRERLKQAFEIVLESDISVYKILTWLAQFLFVLELDVTKIESNEMILAAFADKTLFGMYDMLQMVAQKIPWIVITDRQHEKIMTALGKKCKGGSLYGEMKYSECFMKYRGERSGKKSISDWMNRMNDMISEKMGKAPFGED